MQSRAERAGILLDLALLGLAVYLFIVARSYASYAGPGQVGPDAWPRAIVALMGLAACADLASRIRARRRSHAVEEAADVATPTAPGSGRGALFAAAGMILVVAYAAVLPTVGFFFSTCVFLPLILWLGGYRTWWIVPIGIGGTVALVYIFQAWLGINFPIGTGGFERATVAIYHALHVY